MPDILVGDYLLERLKQLGIQSVFGVPGDYELAFLDLVLKSKLQWKGNPNELVASYAADGYARINGVGALVTTFGPGETSALCGIAGSYTEFVPVVHIVGYPSIQAQRKHMILHHTLGEGKFNNYHEMSKQITCADTVLDDVALATAEIDRVLNAMLYHSQPVYIGLPTDIAFMKVPSAMLSVPLQTELDPNNPALETHVIDTIRSQLDTHEKTIVIVDGAPLLHSVLEEIQELLGVLAVPAFVTPMGKGTVDEQHPRFGGLYAGAGSRPEVREFVESASCVIWIGNYAADLNSGEFTRKVNPEFSVDFQRHWVQLGPYRYNVKMKHTLRALVTSLKKSPPPVRYGNLTYSTHTAVPETPVAITHDWLWPRLTSFLREDDLVVVETGTSASGFGATHLPKGVITFTQEVWGSIGYATGAALGAFIAAKELPKKRRAILITGDGSLQLTAQAFGDILRYDIKPIIFVLNNDGYTVERLIHGIDQPYNDIARWRYTGLLNVFGPDFKSESYLVRNADELDSLLNDRNFGDNDSAKLVELILDKYDGPGAMKAAGKLIDHFNATGEVPIV